MFLGLKSEFLDTKVAPRPEKQPELVKKHPKPPNKCHCLLWVAPPKQTRPELAEQCPYSPEKLTFCSCSGPSRSYLHG